MANDCLVTKLKGVVDNPSLMKLGELSFDVYLNGIDMSTVVFEFATEKAHTVRILEGNFTILDENGNDVGTSYTVNGRGVTFKLPNNLGVLRGRMSISDSYEITHISSTQMWEGRISVKYMPLLTDFRGGDGLLISDSVEDFFYNKTLDYIRGVFEENNIDIAKLQYPVRDTCDFRKIYSNNNFIGDISRVSTGISFLLVAGQFTWETERPAGSPILVLQCSSAAGYYYGCNLGDYVDAYLNNCVSGINSTRPEAWYNAIVIYGNRTSASDSAVAALKARGYTITVNDIEL